MSKVKANSNKDGRLYPLWKSMRYRCYSPTSKDYKNYGGRGIKICKEWEDFNTFAEWAIANGYKEEKTPKGINILTIDRIDVNGDYRPDNCRFVTNAVQAKNKRTSLTDLERYRKCEICGTSFAINQRSSHKTTCSKECYSKYCSIRRTSKKDYTKICPECGKPYNAKRGGHYNQAKYCSKECKRLSESPVWEYNGEKLHVLEWAERLGMTSHCLLHRKELGWDIERILTTPKRGNLNGRC